MGARAHRCGKLLNFLANWIDAELIGQIPPHHSSYQSLRHIGIALPGDRIPGARRIVMRVARPPYDFRGEILRQFLDQSFLGVKAEHNIAVLPHLFRARC